MKKLFVKLQVPVIELKVTAKDASGARDNLVVGFKRYETVESDKQLKLFQEALQDQIDSIKNEVESTVTEDFIKKNIVYLRNLELELLDEDDKPSRLSVNDTRKAKPVTDLWENPEECLETLLDLLLASAPYKSVLISSLQKALVNVDYEDDTVKN